MGLASDLWVPTSKFQLILTSAHHREHPDDSFLHVVPSPLCDPLHSPPRQRGYELAPVLDLVEAQEERRHEHLAEEGLAAI